MLEQRLQVEEDSSSLLAFSHKAGIKMSSLNRLIEIFSQKAASASRGNNVDFMKVSLGELMEEDPDFHYPLRQNEVTALVRELRELGYITPRSYPKSRKKPHVEGRQFLSEQKIFDIITTHRDQFLRAIQREHGLDEGFRAFGIGYNSEHGEDYFPLKWKSLSEDTKAAIKDIFDFGKGNIRALDTGGLRFSSREEILENPYFREYIIHSIQEGRRNGIRDFRTIMRQALTYWYRHFRLRIGLRAPVALTARKGVRSTLKIHMGALSSSPHDILTSLHIDPRIWTDASPSKIPTPNIDRIFSAHIFTYRGASLERIPTD